MVCDKLSLTSQVYEASKEGHTHHLVQFSAPWCQRCPEFTKCVEQLEQKFKFSWHYALLPEAEELKETYEIAKLPAIILLENKTLMQTADKLPKPSIKHQATSPQMLQDIVSKYCPHVQMTFDDDF